MDKEVLIPVIILGILTVVTVGFVVWCAKKLKEMDAEEKARREQESKLLKEIKKNARRRQKAEANRARKNMGK